MQEAQQCPSAQMRFGAVEKKHWAHCPYPDISLPFLIPSPWLCCPEHSILQENNAVFGPQGQHQESIPLLGAGQSIPSLSMERPPLCLAVVFAQAAGDISALHPLQILQFLLFKHHCFLEAREEFPLKQDQFFPLSSLPQAL